jgi:hypothetical protein
LINNGLPCEPGKNNSTFEDESQMEKPSKDPQPARRRIEDDLDFGF